MSFRALSCAFANLALARFSRSQRVFTKLARSQAHGQEIENPTLSALECRRWQISVRSDNTISQVSPADPYDKNIKHHSIPTMRKGTKEASQVSCCSRGGAHLRLQRLPMISTAFLLDVYPAMSESRMVWSSMLVVHLYSSVTKQHGESTTLSRFSMLSPRTSLMTLQSPSKAPTSWVPHALSSCSTAFHCLNQAVQIMVN
jgi:hypothetical protein